MLLWLKTEGESDAIMTKNIISMWLISIVKRKLVVILMLKFNHHHY